MLLRFACIGTMIATVGAGQPAPDALSTLQKDIEARTQEWKTLAAGMEDKVARLLPCDPKARAAIDEISRASAVRLGVLGAYLQLALDKAAVDTRGAKLLLATEEARASDGREQTDDAQERAGVEGQTTDLAESVKRRAALREAQAALAQGAEALRQRAAVGERESERAGNLAAALKDLVTAYQAREDALREEQTAFQTEQTRWNAYYAARFSRTQTECSIVNPAPAKPAPRRTPAAKRNKR